MQPSKGSRQLEMIEQISNVAELRMFLSMSIRLAWLEKTRPDLAFETPHIGKVIRTIFEQDTSKHCKRLNKTIRHAHDSRESMCIPKLELDTPRVVA